MDTYTSEWDVLSVATGAGACAVAYILWLDAFPRCRQEIRFR
jgi:hypothetical protein